MITAEYAVSKSVEAKTTLKLQAGDVTQEGNIFHGFYTYTIVSVEADATNKNKVSVTRRDNNGAEFTMSFGKNTTWYVVKAGN